MQFVIRGPRVRILQPAPYFARAERKFPFLLRIVLRALSPSASPCSLAWIKIWTNAQDRHAQERVIELKAPEPALPSLLIFWNSELFSWLLNLDHNLYLISLHLDAERFADLFDHAALGDQATPIDCTALHQIERFHQFLCRIAV